MDATREIIAADDLLSPYLPPQGTRFQDRLSALVRQQLDAWPGLRRAHEGLRRSLYRKMFLNDLEVELQHNPSRMKSSSAQVDTQAVQERACFLCPDNLYPEQRALAYRGDWLVLCNPYPIFPGHLVVAHVRHVPQAAGSCLGDMLAFVADAGGAFEAFYNGPACGASAPDHLHFQAYPEGGIPLVAQAQLLAAAGMGLSPAGAGHGGAACFAGEVDRRGVFMCRSRNAVALERELLGAVAHLKEATRASGEPLVNIIAAADGPDLVGLVLPRKTHRPGCYFRQDGGRMLVSPGAVDVGGLLVLPRREDYDRMNRDLALGIFAEVCLGGGIWRQGC